MTKTIKHELYVEDSDEYPDGIRMVELPAHYEVCDRCRGEGTHVNPSIDGHGLGPEDFEDEDFREGYFSGRYDVVCEECGGKRVVLVEDDVETFNAEQKADYALLQEQWEQEAADRRESEMERRMGA